MQIPSYQIRNVLKAYSLQLTQDKIQDKIPDKNNPFRNDIKTSGGGEAIASGGKRQATIDKAAASIINRIITEGPKEETEKIITGKKKSGQKTDPAKNKNQFTYTVIDENNQKTTHILKLEDPIVSLKNIATRTICQDTDPIG